ADTRRGAFTEPEQDPVQEPQQVGHVLVQPMSGAGGRRGAGRVGAGGVGAGEPLLAGSGERSSRWSRTNHRGEPVSLYEGPLLAAGAMAGLALAPGLPSRARFAAVAATGTAAPRGAYDDRSDVRTPGDPVAKGFRG